MPQVDGSSLAEKPNLASLLRCRWGVRRRLAAPFVLRAAIDVAYALEYMHAHGICHGDVYAHNVLAADDGASVLCDYGALVCRLESRGLMTAPLLLQPGSQIFGKAWCLLWRPGRDHNTQAAVEPPPLHRSGRRHGQCSPELLR